MLPSCGKQEIVLQAGLTIPISTIWNCGKIRKKVPSKCFFFLWFRFFCI